MSGQELQPRATGLNPPARPMNLVLKPLTQVAIMSSTQLFLVLDFHTLCAIPAPVCRRNCGHARFFPLRERHRQECAGCHLPDEDAFNSMALGGLSDDL